MYTPLLFTAFHLQDAANRVEASSARAAARDTKTEVNMLKCEIERLLMITEALWTIIKEKSGCDDRELVKRITEIDLRDGKLDGRVAVKKGPLHCPRCKRTLSKRIPVCIYCGTAVAKDPFAR